MREGALKVTTMTAKKLSLSRFYPRYQPDGSMKYKSDIKLALTSASVMPSLFFVTFSDFSAQCSTRFLRLLNFFSGLTSSLHG